MEDVNDFIEIIWVAVKGFKGFLCNIICIIKRVFITELNMLNNNKCRILMNVKYIVLYCIEIFK